MTEEIERLRQLSRSCRKQAKITATEEAADILIAMADDYEARALYLLNARAGRVEP